MTTSTGAAARRRRRSGGRGGGGGGHSDGTERWMVSYMDMVTVLMCLFIVMFAISNVDKQKFEELRNSLATGFGQTPTDLVDTATGVVVPPEQVDEDGEGFTAAVAAVAEVEELTRLQREMEDRLVSTGLRDRVGFRLDARGLTVKLVGTETFFDGNSADLRAEARAVLDAIGPILARIPNDVSVEGHADPLGNPAPFPTDWELSASRATSVLRHLVEVNGTPGPRISSVGFGSARPAGADSPSNRRVDIVVLSQQSEAVRSLIPGVLDGTVAPGAPGGADAATADPQGSDP